MISYPFDYVRPETVEEALEHLGGDTKILAGGHSLIPVLKLRLSAPDKLVDIARIASLKKIKKDGDILIEIRFPVPGKGTKMTYQKFTQPASRFALVGCAAARLPDGSARVAFTGVADAPFRDKGVEEAVGDWSASALEAAAAHAAEGQNINADHYASEEYRLHLAKVYCKRALVALV